MRSLASGRMIHGPQWTWTAWDWHCWTALMLWEVYKPARLCTAGTTGQQQKKIQNNASSRCPRCNQPDETQENILQCPKGQAKAPRYNALVKLCSSITTTIGSSRSLGIFLQTLTHWLVQSNPILRSMPLSPPTVTGSLWTLSIETLVQQGKLGWKYATRGFLSDGWSAMQALETNTSLGQVCVTWTPRLLKWDFWDTLWKQQNEKLHSNKPQATMIQESIPGSGCQARLLHFIMTKKVSPLLWTSDCSINLFDTGSKWRYAPRNTGCSWQNRTRPTQRNGKSEINRN